MAVELKQIENCIGCGSCVLTCPCDVFRLDEKAKKTVIAYPEDCQVCSMQHLQYEKDFEFEIQEIG